MNKKELTKTFMMVSNNKTPSVSMGLTIYLSALGVKGLDLN